jgi:hypothetical protein
MNKKNKQKGNESTLLNKLAVYAVIIGVIFLVIYIPAQIIKGNRADKIREAEKQARLEIIKKFDEINVERNAPYKISVDIMLRDEVTESELKEIANLIYYDKTGENYDRIFIRYFLWNQTINDIPWATANFEPDLRIKFN